VTSRLHHLQPGDLLTITEVLEVVPVSRSWLHERIRREELPAMRLAEKLVIHRDDLAGFLDRQRIRYRRPNGNARRLDVDGVIAQIRREAS
jgi:Helix-turn-helix domain